MKKFKIGDTVKRTKDNHFGMKVGDCATVERVGLSSLTFHEYEGYHSKEKFELVVDFHWGEDVEASREGVDYHKGKFIGVSPTTNEYIVEYESGYIERTGYCRKPQITELTLDEIAEKFGVDVNNLKIKKQ